MSSCPDKTYSSRARGEAGGLPETTSALGKHDGFCVRQSVPCAELAAQSAVPCWLLKLVITRTCKEQRSGTDCKMWKAKMWKARRNEDEGEEIGKERGRGRAAVRNHIGKEDGECGV
eukprot:960634-Rhodomonas_salina.8